MTNQPQNKPFTKHRTPVRVKLPGSEIVKIREQLVNDPGLRKKLPEELFVQYFLPMFAGLETHPDINIGRWVSIAGTPFAEVDIFDKQGNILFTVPPIYERNVIDVTKNNTFSLAHITHTFELLQHQSPHRAIKFFEHNLDKVDKSKDLETWYNKYVQRMQEIFDRYQVKPSWANESTSQPSSNSPGGKNDKPPVFDEELL